MSDDLARARAWLAAGEAKHPLPPTVTLTPDSFRTFLMEAFVEGLFAARDDFSVEAATGQRQLDDATALMTEARDLFRGYEAHHREKVERFPGRPDVPDDVAAFKVLRRKFETNALMAARLDAWLKGEPIYPTTVDRATHPAFHEGGLVEPEAVPVVLVNDFAVNPADVLRGIATQIGEATGREVDHDSFDRAAAMLNEPVAVQYIEPDDPSPLVAAMTASIDEISSLPVAPAQSLAEIRRTQAVLCGFTYWPGGDAPPLDLETDGEVLIDWGNQPSGPRFTICGVEELTPMPGLWAETVDPESFGTIIGYRSDPDRAAPADVKAPSSLVAGEPSPLAALVQARNWLLSAERLIAEAAEHIRGVTGASPGSDSAELCARLDAWLTPMATRPADEGAEKEARRSSVTHQGE